MSVEQKLDTIEENVPKVYEAGREDALFDAWGGIQLYGERTNYSSYFKSPYWDDVTFDPKYDFNINNGYYMFGTSRITNICEVLERNNIVFDTSAATSNCFQYMFHNCFTREIPDLVVPEAVTNMYQTMGYCHYLHTVRSITVHENLNYMKNDTFRNLTNLENLTIKGTIGQNNFNVQWSTKLSHDSLMTIINALKDYSEDTSGTQWVVTIGSANKAKLTAEELAIATDKGWEVE